MKIYQKIVIRIGFQLIQLSIFYVEKKLKHLIWYAKLKLWHNLLLYSSNKSADVQLSTKIVYDMVQGFRQTQDHMDDSCIANLIDDIGFFSQVGIGEV